MALIKTVSCSSLCVHGPGLDIRMGNELCGFQGSAQQLAFERDRSSAIYGLAVGLPLEDERSSPTLTFVDASLVAV